MDDKISFSYKLASSRFAKEYIRITAPIIADHTKIFLETIDKDIDFNTIGTDKEIKIKEISNYYGLLQTVISDLEKVLLFLRFKNRNKLEEIYPELENQEDYYRYHFENYIIRVNTITDVLGKLGNLIFETGIDIDDCNGYVFKEKIKKTDTNASSIIEKLLIKTKDIKEKRHKKIHTGESEINYLEGIAFFDDIFKIFQQNTDPHLIELTDSNLNQEINKLEQEIFEIIDIVNEFLDYSVTKYIEITKK